MAKKIATGLAASIGIVLHSAQLTEGGERRDGGSTMIVGEDISAVRALDLLGAHQVSNSDEQAEAGFDLQAALEAAAADELAALEAAAEEPVTDASGTDDNTDTDITDPLVP